MSSQTKIKLQERRSRSFSALKKPHLSSEDKEEFNTLNSSIYPGTVKNSRFASLKEMNSRKGTTKSSDGVLPSGTFDEFSSVEINNPVICKINTNTVSGLKDPTQLLEPINEIPDEGSSNTNKNKYEHGFRYNTDKDGSTNKNNCKLNDTEPIRLTESNIQEMLLSYTFNSADTDQKVSSLLSLINTKKEENKKPQTINNRLREVWAKLLFSSVGLIEKIQDNLYEYFCLTVLHFSIWFPKVVGSLSDLLGEDVVAGASSVITNHLIPFIISAKRLINTGLSKISQHFRIKPFQTLFLLSLSLGFSFPAFLFVSMIVSFSTIYFFLYLVLFVAIGIISSLFIIPLLGASFVFASGVVVFGFLSNITFRMAQSIYVKVDKKLKFTLNKMSSYTNSENKKPSTGSQFFSTKINQNARTLNNKNNNFNRDGNLATSTIRGIDIPLESSTSATSAIARSLETRADIKVAY